MNGDEKYPGNPYHQYQGLPAGKDAPQRRFPYGDNVDIGDWSLSLRLIDVLMGILHANSMGDEYGMAMAISEAEALLDESGWRL